MAMLLALALLQLLSLGFAQEDDMETITGTIFCNNGFAFYVNGELVAEDPIPILHNAVNVSFTIPRDEEVVLAIEGRDLADEVTGLEFDNRCLGGGSLRAIFSNGVRGDQQQLGMHHTPLWPHQLEGLLCRPNCS